MNGNTPNNDHHDVPLEERKRVRGKDLPKALRKKIIAFILDRSAMVNGSRKANHGAYAAAANFFSSSDCNPVDCSSARDSPSKGGYTSSLKRTGLCGRNPIYNAEEMTKAIAKVPIKARQTVRATAREISIPSSTLSKMLLADTFIHRHSAAVKPKLTPVNRLHQLCYAMSTIKNNNQHHNDAGYDDLHVDEKWFF
jgi:hypothetical protein